MREVKGGGFFGALLGFVVGVIASAFVDVKVDGQVVSGESEWLIGGIVGATFGSMLPF